MNNLCKCHTACNWQGWVWMWTIYFRVETLWDVWTQSFPVISSYSSTTKVYRDLLTLFQLHFKNPKALANAKFLKRELLLSSATVELGQFWHQFLSSPLQTEHAKHRGKMCYFHSWWKEKDPLDFWQKSWVSSIMPQDKSPQVLSARVSLIKSRVVESAFGIRL